MSQQFVTMLPVETHTTLFSSQIANHIHLMYRNEEMPVTALETSVPMAEAKESVMFEYAGVPFTVMFMDVPLPADLLTQAYQASPMFPEARKEISRHTAHVIIAPLSKSDDHEVALRLATLSTFATAAISALLPSCLGIYWALGDVLSSPEQFREAARMRYRENRFLPMGEWIQFNPMPTGLIGSGLEQWAMVTKGLQPFVGRELEFMPTGLPVSEIGPRLLSIAGYLMQKGPIIKDGENLGLAENERVHVVFADEGQAPGVPVMRLYWEASADA